MSIQAVGQVYHYNMFNEGSVTCVIFSSNLNPAQQGQYKGNFIDCVQDLSDSSGLEHVAVALTLAFLLDLMWAERPGKRVEASPWYESASKLANDLLAARLHTAPQVW